MEADGFDLAAYLQKGVENLVKRAVRVTAGNPRESAYMARFAISARDASRRRAKAEENGEHIPAFLIASITSACNLHCAGCYSRQFHTEDNPSSRPMTREDWERIFSEAEALGISFILLAGGEPLLRRDVVEIAGNHPDILFPLFTNGTLLDDRYLRLFRQKRNLLPMISIEGKREKTDGRRGDGVYERARSAMESLRDGHLVFGVSVTVTTANLREVTGRDFLDDLRDSGCQAVIYVEWVPVSGDSAGLAPGKEERDYLRGRLTEMRDAYSDMVFISFPGDEKSSGGCLAAGRGFFHINPYGGAEPCPFSPYSDINVKNASLRSVCHSPLFTKLREQNLLTEDHTGGCVLFEQREKVQALSAT